MTTWQQYKKGIKSISSAEMLAINTLADLQTERIKRGISRHTLAAAIGMTAAELAQLEDSDVSPSLATLSRYAKRLGLRLEIAIVP